MTRLAKLALLPALILALASSPSGPARAAEPPEGAWSPDAYHDLAEVEERLEGWASRPEVDVLEIGHSAGDRPLRVLRLAADGPVAPDERPAVFVGANIAGFHNAGTEAALHLVETLLSGEHDALLAERTFYVAPVLNPDAHDALFAPVRVRRSGADGRLDRDRDGLEAEDGSEDLDGDGRVTRMRIPDPAGRWLPHPEEPRLMVRADPMEERAGAFRVVGEGRDDDGDGAYNEDPPWGVAPDRNFAHRFPYPDPAAGPWPSYAPEARAVMDFLLARRNVAFAVVYGPANNLLAKPQSLGGGGDLGTQKFTLPEGAADFLGLDPDGEYTIDEVWEVAKDLPMVVQNDVTKEQLAQFLGAGPATRVADEDMAVIDRLAEAYGERLEAAGLAEDRPAEQYGEGGFTPWLYYQYGTLALELDVWGVPKPEKDEAEDAAGDGAAETRRAREVLAWLDANAPGAVSPWTEVTLPDGTRAEVGGLDPFAELAPPWEILEPALAVHTETVLDAASRIARLEVLELEAEPLADGVVRVRAVAGNRGFFPTHTAMAQRARTHLPVRLELVAGDGVELVTGYPAVTAERLEGSTGTVEGSWLVRAEPGSTIRVRVVSDHAGRDEESITVRKGA